MKKSLIILSALALMLSACNKTNNKNTESKESGESTSQRDTIFSPEELYSLFENESYYYDIKNEYYRKNDDGKSVVEYRVTKDGNDYASEEKNFDDNGSSYYEPVVYLKHKGDGEFYYYHKDQANWVTHLVMAFDAMNLLCSFPQLLDVFEDLLNGGEYLTWTVEGLNYHGHSDGIGGYEANVTIETDYDFIKKITISSIELDTENPVFDNYYFTFTKLGDDEHIKFPELYTEEIFDGLHATFEKLYEEKTARFSSQMVFVYNGQRQTKTYNSNARFYFYDDEVLKGVLVQIENDLFYELMIDAEGDMDFVKFTYSEDKWNTEIVNEDEALSKIQDVYMLITMFQEQSSPEEIAKTAKTEIKKEGSTYSFEVVTDYNEDVTTTVSLTFEEGLLSNIILSTIEEGENSMSATFTINIFNYGEVEIEHPLGQ